MAGERIIKKYPNRRLYDTAVSRYVTLQDILELVKQGVRFKVVDAKSDEDITRGILLQIILEQEERGQPMFSNALLEHIIRTYGGAMQGFMAAYLEQSVAVFLKQQQLMHEQMAALMESGPLSVFGDLARNHARLWQSAQDSILNAYRKENPRRKNDSE